jgi:hypothetical protein
VVVAVVEVLTSMVHRAHQRQVLEVLVGEALVQEVEPQLLLELQTLVVAEVVVQETEGLLSHRLLVVQEL